MVLDQYWSETLANVGPILALVNIGPIFDRYWTTLDQYCTNIQPICNQYYLLYLSFSRFPLPPLIPVGFFHSREFGNGKTHSRGITGNPGKQSVSTEESSRRDLTLVHINLAVENAISASTEVGSTVNKYL